MTSNSAEMLLDTERSRASHSLGLLILCLLLLLATQFRQSSPVGDEKNLVPSPHAEDWNVHFHDLAHKFSDSENPAIHNSMQTLLQITQGQAVSWPECPEIFIQTHFLTQETWSHAYFQIPAEFSVQKDTFLPNRTIGVKLLVGSQLWSLVGKGQAEILWHEVEHLRQICILASSLPVELDDDTFSAQLRSEFLLNIPRLEAEVLSTHAFWYWSSGSTDFHTIMTANRTHMKDEFLSLLNVWESLFLGEKEHLWSGQEQYLADILSVDVSRDTRLRLLGQIPTRTDGTPDLTQHLNWTTWVEAVRELYFRPVVRFSGR